MVAVCVLLTSPEVRAEGWLTGWIPGAKKESSASSKSGTTRTPMLGGRPLRSTSKSTSASQPTMWQRMTNGTKRLASRTKDALTWGDEKPKARHSSWDDQPTVRPSRKPKAEGRAVLLVELVWG
jgi:hypothetical protein